MKADLFDNLWDSYTQLSPSAQAIHDIFVSEKEEIVNDHIAFRTFNDSKMNIDVISKRFLEMGYEKKQYYKFREKHLNAVHLEHPTEKHAPKVFISELIVAEFSQVFQTKISDLIHSIPAENYEDNDIILKGNIWGTPSFETYELLRNESEYAAWLYVHGFRANHFTISINALKKMNSIEMVNKFIKENGYALNNTGGEIKGEVEDLLQQSSTLAEIVEIEFKEGRYKVPACFYEFAIRYTDLQGKLFSGFIAKNANSIFDSTNFRD